MNHEPITSPTIPLLWEENAPFELQLIGKSSAPIIKCLSFKTTINLATFNEAKDLWSMDTSFGVPYLCQTWDTSGRLGHFRTRVPAVSFYFYFFWKFASHGRDTYLLFLFSFNLERLSSYLLFTLLDLILSLYSNFQTSFLSHEFTLLSIIALKLIYV